MKFRCEIQCNYKSFIWLLSWYVNCFRILSACFCSKVRNGFSAPRQTWQSEWVKVKNKKEISDKNKCMGNEDFHLLHLQNGSVSQSEKPNNKILGSLEIPSKMTTTTSTLDSKTKMYSFMVIFTAYTSCHLVVLSIYIYNAPLLFSFHSTFLLLKYLFEMTQHYPVNWLKNA